MATEAFTVVGKLTLDASQFEKDLQKAEQQAESGQQGTKASTVAWGNVMSSTIQKVSGALLNFGKDTIKTGMDFNASMSKVQALTGANDKQFARMRDTAQEMGRTTVFTATEAADAMGYLAQAGWKTDQIIAGIPGVLSLAASSGTGLAESASIASNAMNAFGMSADQVGHFADMLAVTAGAADTNVSLMGETFKYVAANAGAFNISATDMAESIGLIANAGIKGSNAGTALSRILTNITTNKDAKEAIKELGVEIFDTSGKMRDWGDIVGDARVAWQGLSSDQQKASFAKSIAGQYGLAAWNALMNTSTESAEQFRAALENSEGAAALMSQGMLDNLKGDLTLLNSAFDGLKLLLSDTFDTQLRGATQSITGFITGITDLIQYGPGGVIERTARQEEKAINDAETKALEAKGIVSYMDELVAKFGDAATKTDEWQDALGKLKDLLPGVGGVIQGAGNDAKAATTAIGEYIEKQKQLAILEAKEAAIGTYRQNYADAQVNLGKAQINQEVASYQMREAAQSLSQYVEKAYTDAYSSMIEAVRNDQDMTAGEKRDEIERISKEYNERNLKTAAELMAGFESGAFNINDLANFAKAAAAFGGDYNQSSIDSIVSMFNTAQQAFNDSSAQIADLSQKTVDLKAQLDVAEAAYARMSGQADAVSTDDLNTAVSAATAGLNHLASEAASFRAPGFGGGSNPAYQAIGGWDIPYDNFLTRLHRGEMVLNATQARKFRDGNYDSGPSAADIGAAVRSAMLGMAFVSNNETIGRVVGDQTTNRVNRNIGQMSRRHRYGYGG